MRMWPSPRLQAAVQLPLAAAAEHEDRKRNDRDTARRCQEHGVTLVPFVVESFGGWCQSAQDAIGTLAYYWAAKQGTDLSMAVSYVYTGLSSRLWRANARSVLARLGTEEASRNTAPRGRARTALVATA